MRTFLLAYPESAIAVHSGFMVSTPFYMQ